VTSGELTNDTVTPRISATGTAPVTIVSTLASSVGTAAYVSGTAISAADSYTLVATATNAYGAVTQTVPFTLYLTAPVVTITGAYDGEVTNQPITPTISVADAYPVTTTILLGGQPFVSGTTITASATYTLKVTSADLAGNKTVVSIGFQIDTTAPVIHIGGVADGDVVKGPVTLTYSVTSPHDPTVTTAILGDSPFVSGTVVSGEGAYDLVVSSVDQAGNSANVSWPFAIDDTPPNVEIQGVTDGSIINYAVTPIVTSTDANPGTTVLTLNGAGRPSRRTAAIPSMSSRPTSPTTRPRSRSTGSSTRCRPASRSRE